MEPEFGDFTMAMEGVASYSIDDPAYPLDGRGLTADDADLAMNREAVLSVVTALSCGRESANTYIRLFHGDGTRAFHYTQNDSARSEWSPDLGPEGMVLRGRWYATFGDTSPEWNVSFKVITP